MSSHLPSSQKAEQKDRSAEHHCCGSHSHHATPHVKGEPDWDAIAAMPEFQALTRRKARFIIAGTLFFLVYYFALPTLVGYFPALMERRVGPVNWAYLFALSQFLMAWVVAVIYVKVAAGWDRSSEAIIAKSGNR